MSVNGSARALVEDDEPSSSQDRSPDSNLNVGRAVTDAVHERFRQNLIYCESCKETFIGNGVSIKKHFNRSHLADVKCIYCSGKVHHYYKVKNNDNKAEKFYYHRCRDWMSMK
ncbi:hypothetical protein TKK_0002616 [Trichogramma kaykai]|uniref:C2H2-type domain-containing protein n=1 Tax=Trichogramma kaykai TaxID=54128 RepID=A0ABD2WXQ3_9HYME